MLTKFSILFVSLFVVPILTLARPASPITGMSSGENHVCVLSGGRVTCWGDDSYGQLQVPSGLNQVKEIVAGFNHTCAMTDQQIRCWGKVSFEAHLGVNGSQVIQSFNYISAGANGVCYGTTSSFLNIVSHDFPAGFAHHNQCVGSSALMPASDFDDLGSNRIRKVWIGDVKMCRSFVDGHVDCVSGGHIAELQPRFENPINIVFAHIITCAFNRTGFGGCFNTDGESLGAMNDIRFLATRNAMSYDDEYCTIFWSEYNQRKMVGCSALAMIPRWKSVYVTDRIRTWGAVDGLSMGLSHLCAYATTDGVRCDSFSSAGNTNAAVKVPLEFRVTGDSYNADGTPQNY